MQRPKPSGAMRIAPETSDEAVETIIRIPALLAQIGNPLVNHR